MPENEVIRKIAAILDIHGSTRALEALLNEIEQQNP